MPLEWGIYYGEIKMIHKYIEEDHSCGYGIDTFDPNQIIVELFNCGELVSVPLTCEEAQHFVALLNLYIHRVKQSPVDLNV